MGRYFKPGQLETGSLYDISSSFAISASHTSGTFQGAATGSFSGSFFGNGNGIFSGSFSGSITANLQQVTDNGSVTSNAITASGLQTTQLEVAGISYATTSASFDSRILNNSSSISTVSSSFDIFTQTYNTASFTGSFTGDGVGLYNIPAAGIVGLNLSQIASGSVTASISPVTGFNVNTNTQITGSLTVTTGITGSLFGTSSWAVNAISSSFATSASWAPDTTFPFTGSAIISGSLVVTGSTNIVGSSGTSVFTTNADTLVVTGSILLSGSMITDGSIIANEFTGSLFGTSSWADNAVTASYIQLAQTASYVLNAVSSSFAQTASFAPAYLPLTGGTINGDVTVNGTASISFLNVIYESASVIYSSGSNQFGDADDDIQTLYGTVIMPTGSLIVTGSTTVTNGITGSLFGTASWAENSITASYAFSASYIDGGFY